MTQLSPPLQHAPLSDEGLSSFWDQLPLGLAWADASGRVLRANAIAQTVLDSAAGLTLKTTISRLIASHRQTSHLVSTIIDLTETERVTVSVAFDPSMPAYVISLDRQQVERARSEAVALRSVLKAVAQSDSRQEALRHALDAVTHALAASALFFFELDASGDWLTCTVAAGASATDFPREMTVSAEPSRSVLGAALHYGNPVTLLDLREAEGPWGDRSGQAAVMPVLGGHSRGVLLIVVPELSPATLRLCCALADAVTAVVELASLEEQANHARHIATERDRLATIGQLMAGVAHEVNNPLAFVKCNLYALQKDLHSPEAPEMVADSIEGLTRIENIVAALKMAARNKSERLRFDPSKSIQEAVTVFRGAHKAECDFDCDITAVPPVMGSPSALIQVLLNLMQNGLDAMAGAARALRKLEISVRRQDAWVIVSVRDFGPGIAADVQERLFEAFFTTKAPGKGTGLGLPICRETVEAMGGTLTYTTGPDGTCFEVRLPVCETT